VHLPVPFSAQHGAGPEFGGTLTQAHGTLSGLLGRPRAIEQAYDLGVQVTQLIGLQPVVNAVSILLTCAEVKFPRRRNGDQPAV